MASMIVDNDLKTFFEKFPEGGLHHSFSMVLIVTWIKALVIVLALPVVFDRRTIRTSPSFGRRASSKSFPLPVHPEKKKRNDARSTEANACRQNIK